MNAIAFQAEIKNGVIQIPEEHQHLYTTNAKVIILVERKEEETYKFDPKKFFGAASESKKKIDGYIHESRSGWL